MYNKEKVIQIKNLKIFENKDKKKDNQVYSFDAITSLEYLPNNHISKIKLPSSSILALILKPTTSLPASVFFLPYIIPDISKPTIIRFRQVFQPPKRYDIRRNTDIKVFLS